MSTNDSMTENWELSPLPLSPLLEVQGGVGCGKGSGAVELVGS